MNTKKFCDLGSLRNSTFSFLSFSIIHPLSSINPFRSFVCGLLSLVFLSLPIMVYADPQVVLPLNTYASGVYDIQPVAVSEEIKSITISAKRNQWPDTGGDVVSVRIELSDDGGRGWAFLCGFTTSGGEVRDRKTGEIKEKSLLQFVLPSSAGGERMVRGSVEFFTSLETEISIDLL